MTSTQICTAVTGIFLLVSSPGLVNAGDNCSSMTNIRGQLETLKLNKWQLVDEVARQTLALALLDCLVVADPVLRDELAFEALSTWMRTKQLTTDTLRRVNTELQARLRDDAADATGFGKPFAVLTLAEAARVDRIQAFLSNEELDQLISSGTKYLTGVRDYRGFVTSEGWRHGVAHGADLMLQLSLNSRLSRTQLDRLLAAIASQVAPGGEHFYHYHEGERLMAPVFYIARKTLHEISEWDAWIAKLTARGDGAESTTQTSLARRHNLAGFLLPLYFSLQESSDLAQRARLLPAVTKALKAMD